MPRRYFEAQGQWWLPGREEQRVAGTLRFDPDSGAELQLIGTFRGMFEGGERSERGGTLTITYSRESIERDGTYPRILGVAGGKPYTLEDCVQTRAVRHLISGGGAETISVSQIYQGAQFDDSAPPSAHAVSVDLRYLTHWIGEGGIQESRAFAPAGKPYDVPGVTLRALSVEDKAVTLPDKAKLRLTHSFRVTGDRITRRGFFQRYYFRIDAPHVLPAADLVERISDLQDLVSIAAGRTAEIDGLRFWHPDIIVSSGEDTFPQAIQFFARWNNRDASKTPGAMPLEALYFTYEQFGGIEGVGRWLDCVAKHRSALGRVVGSRYAKSMYTSDRLLNCAAALESFDRVRGNKGTFKERMKRCAALAGDPFQELVRDIDAWIKVVKDHRNDIAHHLGTQVKQSNSSQFFLARSLYWLFVLCMLRDVQAPAAVFEQIRKHQDLVFLGPKVRAAVQAG